jgi:hypothetical protein
MLLSRTNHEHDAVAREAHSVVAQHLNDADGAWVTIQHYESLLGERDAAVERAVRAERERESFKRDFLAASERREWAERQVATLTEALRWLASDEAWEVTPSYQQDGRYRFNTTSDSVYATPWGFARAALAAVAGQGNTKLGETPMAAGVAGPEEGA